MVIETTNGNTVEYDVTQIKRVYFSVPSFFEVSPTSLSFGPDAKEERALEIRSNIAWQIVDLPSWLDASELKGEETTTVILTTRNASTKEESTTFSVVAAGKTIAVSVKREAPKPFVNASLSDTYFYSTSNVATLTINSNTKWSISLEGDDTSWVSLSKKEGTGDAKVSITIASNQSIFSRTVKLRLNMNGTPTSDVFIITQEGQVAPAYIFEDPCTQWGASKDQVKAYMSGYELYQEKENVLAYIGKYKETMIGYNFTDSQLNRATVIIQSKDATLDEIKKQLTEDDYISMAEEEEGILYVKMETSTIMLLSYDTDLDCYTLNYYDYHSIVPATAYFEEPFITWGTSRTVVKNTMAERGYELIGESNSASDGYYLAYDAKCRENYSMYHFDVLKKLESVGILFLAQEASVDDIREFMETELSYRLIGTNSDGTDFFYATPDMKSCAIVYPAEANSGVELTVIEYLDINQVLGSSVKSEVIGNKAPMNNLNDVHVSGVKMSDELLMSMKAKRIATLKKEAGKSGDMTKMVNSLLK